MNNINQDIDPKIDSFKSGVSLIKTDRKLL